MTAILGIETASALVGCAVSEGEKVKAAMVAHSERSHGEMLAPMVQAVLAEAEMTIDDIGLVAVDCGPGRYTGLRVGIATAAALAYARSLPVVAVGSTELLAFGARKFCGNIVPVVDARRGEAFFAVYQSNGGNGSEDKSAGESLTEISPVSIATPSHLKQRLLQLEGPSLILGDLALDSFDFTTDSSTRISAHYCENRPSPSSLVMLAAQKAAAGQVLEPAELRPLYLRHPDINPAGRSKIMLQ